MPDHIRHGYNFGPFSVDVTARVLFRRGEIVSLTPKAFDLLLVLVQNSGHVLERRELTKAVWPNTFVEESNLTQNIFALRRALGEPHRGHKYIQTLAKRGYRFVASVKEVSGEFMEQPRRRKRGSTARRRSTAASHSSAPLSLAVLPFINLSSDSATDYLCDGISESIANNLSQFPQLKVTGRGSAFRYKGLQADIQEIGRELSVNTVLVGRILTPGDRVVISAELINAANGRLLWSTECDRPASDLISVQEEIVRDITTKLTIQLTDADRKLLANRYTQNTEAYRDYLKGRFFWRKYTREGIEKGIECYQRAIEKDPKYALAYTGLADAYLRLSNTYVSPTVALPKASAAAIRAVEIDDLLAEAHASRGLIKMYYDHDWVGAESEFRRAIELNPGTALGYQRLAECLLVTRRFEQALDMYSQALSLDPLSLQINLNLGTCSYLMGNYDEAIAHFQEVIELDKDYCPAHLGLGCAYLFSGNSREALTELRRARQLDREAHMVLGFLGYAYGISGNKPAALRALNQLRSIARRKYVSPYGIAITYLGLGNRERANEWLHRTYEDHNDFLAWINVLPELDTLRSDARFKDLLRRVGFIM